MSKISKQIREFFSSEDEKKILDLIEKSEFKTRRVIGRGTLTIDSKEVFHSPKFKKYKKKKKKIVNS